MAELLCHTRLDTIINRKRVMFAKALLGVRLRNALVQPPDAVTAVVRNAKDARCGRVGTGSKRGDNAS